MSKVIVVGACLLLVAGPVVGGSAGVASANERPLPDAGLDQTVQRGATVVLDAGGSRDPDGTVTGYRWRIEAPNGTTFTPDGATAARASFVAARSGEYAATVEVTDDDGATATDTLYVTVEAPPEGPDVSLSGDARPAVGATTVYSASATAGDADLETLSWSVDGREVADQALSGNDTTLWISRSFGDASPRTIRVTVRDENGRTATDSIRVDPVSPDPPEPDDAEPPEPEPTSTPAADSTPPPAGTTSATPTATTTPDPCAGNEPPSVDASAEFGGASRGDSVTVSASISDPDGEIVSVSYDPSRIVAAPGPGGTTTVRVTATDDCRVLGTDTLVLSGEEVTYTTNQTEQSVYTNKIRLFYYKGAAGGDPYNSEIIQGDYSNLPPVVSGDVDTHREEQAVVDAETWSVYRDHSPSDAVKENEGPQGATETVTTSTTTTTNTTVTTVEVLGDEEVPEQGQSDAGPSSNGGPDATTPTDRQAAEPGLTSGDGQTVPAGSEQEADPGDAQPGPEELQDEHDPDGDGHEADERADDPNDDGEVETGHGWTVDADGHNT